MLRAVSEVELNVASAVSQQAAKSGDEAGVKK
jgi:hypothetical protein